MTFARHLRRASLALVAVSSMGGLQQAWATGTDAGVSITNRATVSYSVGSVAQTPIESSPTGNTTPGANSGVDTSFLVDRRVFMSVADVTGAPATVPGATGVVRAFTVTNTSNATIGFTLVGSDLGVGDQFDLTNRIVRVDSVAQPTASYSPGTYDSSTDTATAIVALPEDHSVTVYIIGDIPLNVVNGNTALVDLQATAVEPPAPNNYGGAAGSVIASTPGANTAGIDTVLGDTDNNGVENDTNVYTVSSATLQVTKSVAVIDDPINGTAANRKAIPGATLEYTISVLNSGTVDAVTVVVTDPIPGNVAYVAGSLARNGTGLSDASDGDDGQANGTPATSVQVTVPTIAAGATATVTFRVTIN
jgi:uncharacterized repeat protein (TIGR01451 family)